MSKPQLHVTIKSPDTVLYSGDAVILSSENTVGKFDILPNHSNFISLITTEVTLVNLNKKTQNFLFTAGVIKCKDNEISIFIGI